MKTASALFLAATFLGNPGCLEVWVHPPTTSPQDFKPEPRGAKTIEELMAEPVPPPAESKPQPDLAIRVTNCYGRTIGVAFAPVDLCLEVRIKQHAHNRALAVSWASEAIAGASAETLEGADARVTRHIKMTGLFGGMVEVEARVVDGLGAVRASARARVNVVSRSDPPESSGRP